MIQIQFLDRNVMKALVPVFSQRPNQVVFIYDDSINPKKSCNNFKKAIQSRHRNIEVEFVLVDKHNYQDICYNLRQIIEKTNDKIEIVINGGTELMSAAGLRIGSEYNIPVVYVSTSNGYIFNVLTDEKIGEVVNIGVDDYLTATGAKHPSRSHFMPRTEEFEAICRVAEYIFDHIDDWHLLQTFLSIRLAMETDSTTFAIGRKQITQKMRNILGETGSVDELVQRLRETIDIFEKEGFVKTMGAFSYTITKPKYKEYLTVFVIWLEMYVYINALNCFDEVHLGYVIDWDNSDQNDTTDNEIDVVAIKNSVPYFISCKMRKPEAKDVYEIACLAERVGGGAAKAVVATTFPVDKTKDSDKGIYQRMKKMKVGSIEAGKIRDCKLNKYIDAQF